MKEENLPKLSKCKQEFLYYTFTYLLIVMGGWDCYGMHCGNQRTTCSVFFLHEGPGALSQAIRAGTLTRQVITLA